MRFLLDENLPPALAYWFIERGHEARHLYGAGLLGASDPQVVAQALELVAIIVTKDEDFTLSARNDPTVRVLWLRVGNLSLAALRERLDRAWPEALSVLERGSSLVTVE